MRQDDEPVQDGDRFIDTERYHRPKEGEEMKFTIRIEENGLSDGSDAIHLHYDDGGVFGPFYRDEIDKHRDIYSQTDPETGEIMTDLRADE